MDTTGKSILEIFDMWDRSEILSHVSRMLVDIAAKRTYRELICPKCGSEFEDNGKDYPHGLICPECSDRGYTIVGVIHPIKKKILITQEQWDKAIELLKKWENWGFEDTMELGYKTHEFLEETK